MNTKIFLFSFAMIGALALVGFSCINPLGDTDLATEDSSEELDLFDEGMAPECAELKGKLAQLEGDITREKAGVEVAKKECDDIEAGYNKSLADGADSTTLNGIISLHRSCLSGIESPSFGKALEQFENERDATKQDIVLAGC